MLSMMNLLYSLFNEIKKRITMPHTHLYSHKSDTKIHGLDPDLNLRCFNLSFSWITRIRTPYPTLSLIIFSAILL